MNGKNYCILETSLENKQVLEDYFYVPIVEKLRGLIQLDYFHTNFLSYMSEMEKNCDPGCRKGFNLSIFTIEKSRHH